MSAADRSAPAGREEVGRVLRDLIDAGYFAGRTEDVRALPAALEAAEAALTRTASTTTGGDEVPVAYMVDCKGGGGWDVRMWTAARRAEAEGCAKAFGVEVVPLYAALTPPASAPAPAVVGVPLDPTEAMLNAARDWSAVFVGSPIGNKAAIGCWQAMWSAHAPVAAAIRQDTLAIDALAKGCALTCESGGERLPRVVITFSSLPDAQNANEALAHALRDRLGNAPAPAVAPDLRPGLEHAEGIADRWHQRFLVLRDEAMSGSKRLENWYSAEGAKQVLDDIRIERAKLSRAIGDGERDGGGSDG